MAALPQAGNLHLHVRPLGQPRHRQAPTGKSFAAAVVGQPGVVENQSDAGKIPGQPFGFVQVPPGCLQIEMQTQTFKCGVIAAPMLVAHQAAQAPDLLRRGRAAGLVANTAYALETGLFGQHIDSVRMIEPGLRDDCIRHAITGGQLLDETGFANRVLRVPFGLDVHRLHDVVRTCIGEVILGKIAALDRAVVTVAKRDIGFGSEPRVIVEDRVPEMMMGVDDRAVP
ncbi:hypothetical protein D3C85_912000 [compost metagenome]